MARDDPHFRLRIPAEVHDKIREQAEVNGRSMNAEIVHRLELSLAEEEYQKRNGPPPNIYDPEFLEKMDDQHKRFQDLFDKYLGVFAGLDSEERTNLVEILTTVRLEPAIKKYLKPETKKEIDTENE